MKKVFTALSAGVLALLLVAGCGNGNTATQTTNTTNITNTTNKIDDNKPVKGGTLTVALTSDPDTLDPQKTSQSQADLVLAQIGSSLIYLNPDTFEFEPGVAKSWDISRDGLTYTFHLRPDVTFQDGTPLTAQDFADTYKRALDPATSAQATADSLGNVKSITAPDKETLVITLNKPFAWLLSGLSDSGYMQPICPAALKSRGSDFGRHPISTGPWKFNSWQSGQSITLDRYPDFHWAPPFFQNQGAPYPDKLVFKVIAQEETRIAALQTGEVDLAEITPKDVATFANNNKFKVLSYLNPGLGMFIDINTRKPGLGDVKVRQAINYAINRASIIQAVLMGQGEKAYGPLPPSIPDYDPNVTSYGYDYDLAKAGKLLQEAGYTPGSDGYLAKDGQTLSLALNSVQSGEADQAGQLIQAQLKEVGIKVNIQNMDHATLLANAMKGQFDLTLMNYSYLNPDVLYFFFHSKGALNVGGIKSANLDGLLDQSRTTTDPALEKKIYADIQKDVVQNAYWAPIYISKRFYVVNRRVHGVKVSPAYEYLLQDAWVGSAK